MASISAGCTASLSDSCRCSCTPSVAFCLSGVRTTVAASRCGERRTRHARDRLVRAPVAETGGQRTAQRVGIEVAHGGEPRLIGAIEARVELLHAFDRHGHRILQPFVEAARVAHVAARIRVAAPRQARWTRAPRGRRAAPRSPTRSGASAPRAPSAGTPGCAAAAPAAPPRRATVSRRDSMSMRTSSPLELMRSSDFSASSRSWIWTRVRPAAALVDHAGDELRHLALPDQAALVAEAHRHRHAHGLPARGLGQQRQLHAVGQCGALGLRVDVGRRRIERRHGRRRRLGLEVLAVCAATSSAASAGARTGFSVGT